MPRTPDYIPPPPYAPGDDVTSELAVLLTEKDVEIARLRAALREIADIPREQFVMQGPALPASIARRALADQ